MWLRCSAGVVILTTTLLATMAVADPVQLSLPALVHHDVSPPFSDIPASAVPRPRKVHDNPDDEGYSAALKSVPTDPTVQLSVGPLVATTQPLVFAGLGFQFPAFPAYETSSAPLDPNGAVGTFQFVETVNVDYAISNKATHELMADPASISNNWYQLGERAKVTMTLILSFCTTKGPIVG